MKLETQTEQLISETVTVYGLSPQIGVHALAQTANALAAQGTVFSVCPDITEDEETDTDIKNEDMQDTHETSASVSVQIAYPEYVFKSRIHKIEKTSEKACKKYNINLVAVQASANPAVQVIAVTVTELQRHRRKKPGTGKPHEPARTSWLWVMREWMACSGSQKKKNRNLRLVLRRFS